MLSDKAEIEVLQLPKFPETHEKLERCKKGFFPKVSEEA